MDKEKLKEAIKVFEDAKIYNVEQLDIASAASTIVRAAKSVLEESDDGSLVPEKFAPYYCFDVDGTVRRSTWDGIAQDFARLAIGNVYRTKEDAEYAEFCCDPQPCDWCQVGSGKQDTQEKTDE